MSEHNVDSSSETASRHRRDAGFTLPELLVSIIVLGSIVAVLSSTIIVTFQQRDNTEGRLNVSRAEQNVGIWIPADLSSADETPSTLANDSPCPVSTANPAGCPGNVQLTGSNTLLLTWTDDELDTSTGLLVTVTTRVSYHFTPTADGLFDLVRIECRSSGAGWTCENNRVLVDLPGNPDGTAFDPGVTIPVWVIVVSAPLDPEATSSTDPPMSTIPGSNASRVVVTINGGGDGEPSSGAGGISQISITAGGTTRSVLPPGDTTGAPSFSETQSRCGGPITLVVDESNSIGGAIGDVKDGVRLFIDSLAGTPVQLQIVRFHTKASILGDSGAWTKYYDMTNDDDVIALRGAVDDLRGSWSSSSANNGGTNWEDALFRTFQSSNGSVPQVVPRTVVFFTDGIPTYDRLVYRSSPGVLTALPAGNVLPPGWDNSTGFYYSQVAFDRAVAYANKWRAETRMIGVGVGDGIAGSSYWLATAQPVFRSPSVYQGKYQVKNSSSGSWFFVNKSTHDSYASNRRREVAWTAISSSVYNDQNDGSATDESDGIRRLQNGVPKANETILTRLVADNENAGIEGIWDATLGRYTNSADANLYIAPEFDLLPQALKSAALVDCGATLTIQTRLANGNPAVDEFKYHHVATTDPAGVQQTIATQQYTTSIAAASTTIDFDMTADPTWRTVEIRLALTDSQRTYSGGTWECKAGNVAVDPTYMETFPTDPGWLGLRVRVGANEAVSCVHTVT